MGHTGTHTHTQTCTCRGISSGLPTSWAVYPTPLAGCVLGDAGTVAQRAPGVLLPVCSCVEVLGLSLDRDGTRRLLKLALKAATTPHTWQVSSLNPGASAQVLGSRRSVERQHMVRVQLVCLNAAVAGSQDGTTRSAAPDLSHCRCGETPARLWLCWLPPCSSGRCRLWRASSCRRYLNLSWC